MNRTHTTWTPARHRAAVLRVTSLSLMMVVAAVASLNVALPAIAGDTGATQTQLQWIVDAYAVTFAALLLPAGAIGDRHGRKAALLFGIALFGFSSLAAILFHDPSQLIVVRVVMGIGAAFVMPVTLSVVTTVFPPEERGKAVGTWAGVAAGGGVLGLVMSGLLLEWFSWPSVFVVNVVMATLALVGTFTVVPSGHDASLPRLDWVGASLSIVSLGALVFGIIEGPERGWSNTLTVTAIAAGVAGITAFVRWELRTSEPLLNPRNFLRWGFGVGSLSITVQYFAALGFFFIALPYLQLVRDYSPLQAAAAFLPLAAVVIPLSRVSPALATHLGVRISGTAGLTLMAVGFIVLSTIEAGSPYWLFLAGLLPFGAGMALSGAPATTSIVNSLPPRKQGVASAVNDLSRELGGALGIAVLGSIFNGAYRAAIGVHLDALPPAAAENASGSLSAAHAVANQLGERGRELVRQADAAFLSGFQHAMLAAAGILVAGAAFVAWRANERRDEDHEVRPHVDAAIVARSSSATSRDSDNAAARPV